MKDKNQGNSTGAAGNLEVSGRITGIVLEGAGGQLKFEVVSKKDGHRSFGLSQATPGFQTMATLVTSAFMNDTKVHVVGARAATEIRVGAKPKPAKPTKAKKAAKPAPAAEARSEPQAQA